MLISHSPLISGGAEKCLVEYTEVLKKAGNACLVVVPAKGELTKLLTKKDIAWSVVSYVWATKPRRKRDVHSSIENAGRSLAGTLREAKKFKPDIIMVNTMVIPWGLYAGKMLNIPTVLLVHETLSDKQHILDMEPNYEDYVSIINKNTDYIIYNSVSTKRDYADLIKKPVVSKKILYPVPDLKRYIDVKYKENEIADNVKIAIIGSMHKTKNQMEAVKAAKKMIDRGINNFTLNLYGDKDVEYVDTMYKYIKKNHLEKNIEIKGYAEDIYDVINNHNVVLIPFLNESFGRVLLEGQLFGRVVIANDSGANPDLIDDMDTGILYEQGNINQLTDKLIWVLNNQEKALDIGKKARERQRKKYLTDEQYAALFDVVEFFKNHTKKEQTLNRYDPLISLGEYANGVDHKYRHLYRISHNRITRTTIHYSRKAAKLIYSKIKIK